MLWLDNKMDSDEDEEFSFDENITQGADRHGGKLNEILSEVETKIPSLEFDDDDNEEDISVWSPPKNVPSFYKQFSFSLSSEKTVCRDENKQTPEKLCGADRSLPVAENHLATVKLENKSVSTITNAFDKKPITTLQPSSTMYTAYQKDSNLLLCEDDDLRGLSLSDRDNQIYEHDQPVTTFGTGKADKREIVSVQSSESTIGDSLIYEQNFSVDETNRGVAKLDEASRLILSEIGSDQAILNNDTPVSHDAFDNPSSVVSMKSLACQTDNEPSIHKHHSLNAYTDEQISYSTISCQTDSDLSSKERYLPATKSSEKLVNVTARIDEPISTSGSLLSAIACQTENNYLRNGKIDKSAQMLNSTDRNVGTDEAMQVADLTGHVEQTPHSISENKAEYGDQLDFNLLNEINFNELQSMLGTFSSRHALSVSELLSHSSQQDVHSVSASDDELMLKLSDLSKDQLSVCSGVLDGKRDVAESIYQKKRKVKGNRGSTKAIHTWSQLRSEDVSTQEPQTIFLDLRPEANLEKEKQEEEYSQSIQRILGLNKQRSDSSSDDGSEDELTDWREMRTKLKERAKQEPENHKKSTHTYASKLSVRKGKATPLPRKIPNTTVEKLFGEELTGGLPLDICSRYENIEGNGNTQNVKKSSGNVEGVVDESTQTATDSQAEASISSRSKVGDKDRNTGSEVNDKDRNGLSEEKNRYQSVGRTMTENESSIDKKLNSKEIEAQNDKNGHMPYNVDEDETCLESHITTGAVNTCNSTDERHDIFDNENGEYTSSSDSLQDESRVEENIVECLEKENSVAIQERGSDKRLDGSNVFKNNVHVQFDERTVSWKNKSDEKPSIHRKTVGNAVSIDCIAKPLPGSVKSDVPQEANSISTADIRISLQFSGGKENDPIRNSSARGKKNKYKKREELTEDSTEYNQTSQYKTKKKPSNAISEQKTDTTHEKRDEKTSIMDKKDISQKQELTNDVLDIDLYTVHKIIDCMKEEKTKQSLMSNHRTTTLDSEENKQRTRNRMDTRLANSTDATKQKQRGQKEMKKLKEKLRTNLENMRPSVTANGKYPAAYNTPIIYDQDASYEKQHNGLLSATEDQLCLLLVVTLSGCGEINNQHSKGRTLGSGSEVNCYFALVSWFLYLCGPNNSDVSLPFTVVGMQQTCQNGLLQLFVGVQPHENVSYLNATKGSKKNKTRAFHKAISKYLSTRSLRTVYQNIENVYLNGSYLVDENSYSSRMLSTIISIGQDSNAVRRVFNCKPGFYWETMELEGGNDVVQDCHSCDVNVENTVVFIRAPLYYHPTCVLDLFMRIENEGCDVAGLRLTLELDSSASAVCQNGDHEILQSGYDPQPTFILAIRGPFAIAKMKKIIGSKIPLLDVPRGIPSLRSLYCSTNSEDTLFYCPSYSNQAATQLSRVFGGRLTENDLATVEGSRTKSKPSSPDSVPAQKPPAFLVSSTRVAFYLIISPLVPPRFFGELLHICSLRGFVLHGMRRVQLSKRQGTSLGFSQLQFHVFCPSSGNTPLQSPSGSPPGSPARRRSNLSFEATLALARTSKSYPSTILVLQRENGLYHAASLVKHLFESLKDWTSTNPTSLPDLDETSPRMYLTIMQLNEPSSKSLWGDVCFKPSTNLIKHARNNRFSSSSEVEQVCVLSSVNKKAIQHVGILLKKLTNSNQIAGDWELLGMKSFPSLSLVQAREVTPHEVGDRCWLSSVKLLMSAAVFVCVLRGINIINRVRNFITALAKSKEDACLHEGWWLSQTAEVAYRQLTVLFEESELFSDETNRTNTKFVPPLRQRFSQSSVQKESNEFHQKQRRKFNDHKTCSTDDSSTSIETTQFNEVPIIQSLLAGPRPLPTIVLIKPSCVANTKKISKIFKSVLQENFDIVALNMRVLTQSEAHVLVHDDEPEYNDHIQYLSSGASLVLCLQRENAVKKLLDILGPEDPIIARSLDPFLLRGCYGIDSIHNAIHGSESYSSAICELKMLFPCGVCCEQTVDLEAEQIPCHVFDATIGKKTDRKLTKCSSHSSGTAHDLMSSLVQVNCVILTHHIVYGRNERKQIALVEVLECLLSTNFVLVGMKMAILSHDQVNGFLALTGSKSHSKQNLERDLVEGPCIILALQRDNAITCFDSIIESVGRKRRSITEYRKHIIEAKTEDEARNFLLYFFDGLTPNSVQQICPV